MSGFWRIGTMLALAGCLALNPAHAAAATTSSTPTTATVKSDRVNVRGQASLSSEVITQLKKGETVTVLEEIPAVKPKDGEPKSWSKIRMPDNTPVWANASFVDKDSKKVKPQKLNLRAGPGENYSVVGRVPKDTVLGEIRVVGDWMEVENPGDTYGFVASDLLDTIPPAPTTAATEEATKPAPAPAPVETTAAAVVKPAAQDSDTAQSAPAPENNNTTTAPAPAPTPEPAAVVAPPPPVVADSTPAPAPAPAPAPEPAATTPAPTQTEPPVGTAEKEVILAKEQKAAEAAPAPQPAPTPAPVVEPAKQPEPEPPSVAPVTKRIVRREGIVKTTLSPQAPSEYELDNHLNGSTMDYLQPTAPDIKLKPFKGRRVIVTGEEVIDPRWPKTPIVRIETLELAP